MPVSIRGPVSYPVAQKRAPATAKRNTSDRQTYRPWTDADKDYLDAHYGTEAAGLIAHKLGRTVGSIKATASIRGLTGRKRA